MLPFVSDQLAVRVAPTAVVQGDPVADVKLKLICVEVAETVPDQEQFWPPPVNVEVNELD